jgi:DNA-binding transcriptional regulator YiaG
MNQIKELRQRTGLSQAKFGEALGGIPLRTLQDWEHGKRTPPEWVVKLIAFRVENDPQFKR